MKFWTAESDDLVLDLVQCDECSKWIPTANIQLHVLHHQQPGQEDPGLDNTVPAFVMESIPCEGCRVLVPKNNWEIHRAHVCRARRKENTAQEEIDISLGSDDFANIPDIQVIECDACRALVPIHNLELHGARSCKALTSNTQQDDLEGPSQREGNQEGEEKRNEEVEGIDCPQCTYMNGRDEVVDTKWKCAMCGYSSAAPNLDQEGPTTQPGPEKKSNEFWKNLAGSWVPKEYHQFLPESVRPDKKKDRTKKSKQRPKSKLGRIPKPKEVRHNRNHHLSLLERERQQYLDLLHETRAEALELQNSGENKDTVKNAPTPLKQSANPSAAQLTSTEDTQITLEMLQLTERFCLHHLEHLRRTQLAKQFALDIELLSFPRWRHHLQHLLDLYQSASEVYVDNIIWELRMHFMQYATLEMMALLEMKIWKEQIHAILPLDTPMSLETRRACRNEQEIRIICQSVVPFLGRPLTAALRAL